MSSPTTPPHVVEDCRGLLQVFSDGSIRRFSTAPFSIPIRDDGTVEYKDLQFDPTHDLHLRIYKPRAPTSPNLPILFYFHGGGFCLGSRTWPSIHNGCLRLASDLHAIIISPDYRLAPEHRLPAAIDDAFTALEWLRAQATSPSPDPWLAEHADFDRVFISGLSAGGNLTHHLAFRYAGDGAPPLRLRGFVLIMPGFCGTQMTKSEAECPADCFFTMEQAQRYMRLFLPVGETADHPVVNPFGPGAASLEAVQIEPMLVVVAGCDFLIDREVEYVRRLQGWGKPVELVEFAGEQHSLFSSDPWSKAAGELVRVIKRFMAENGGTSSELH